LGGKQGRGGGFRIEPDAEGNSTENVIECIRGSGVNLAKRTFSQIHLRGRRVNRKEGFAHCQKKKLSVGEE